MAASLCCCSSPAPAWHFALKTQNSGRAGGKKNIYILSIACPFALEALQKGPNPGQKMNCTICWPLLGRLDVPDVEHGSFRSGYIFCRNTHSFFFSAPKEIMMGFQKGLLNISYCTV